MSDFFSYLSWFKIVLLVVAFMSGILSILREALLINNEKINEKKLFWRSIWVGFILSSLTLWFTEHATVVDLHSQIASLNGKLDELDKPQIQAWVDSLSSAELHTGLRERPRVDRIIVNAVIVIKNLGAPSTVLPEDAFITLKNGKTIKPYVVASTGKDLVIPNRGGGITTLGAKDYLTTKAFGAPIPRGGAIYGWVEYALPREIQREDLMGGIITIHLSDINEKIITITDTFKYDDMPIFNPSKDD